MLPLPWAVLAILLGGREGYMSLLTIYGGKWIIWGRFCKWPVTTVASRIQGHVHIEPKPMEPTKHQYDSHDAVTVIGFLRYYGWTQRF